MIRNNKQNNPVKKHSSREWSSTHLRSVKSDPQGSQGINGLTTWLDILAKSVVVISAMLYIVGRKYAESYYATMGLPSNNLPISVQEYLFMSTRSFSFLNKALYTFLVSITPAILPSIIDLVQNLYVKLKGSESKHLESNSNPPQSNKIAPTTTNLLVSVWDIIKAKLLYIIPLFLVLSFFILIPGASQSGRIDATEAMLSAPLSEVLLSQPSIPELAPTTFSVQPSSTVYQYGGVQIIGNLGNQVLFLVSDSSGNSSVISIPDSQIISIRYIGTPTPTPTTTSTTIVITPTTASLTGTP